MSYCRFNKSSDVYLYGSGEINFVCCMCLLAERGQNTNLKNELEAINHLEKHQKHGHKVEQWAINRLKDEYDARKKLR